MCADACKQILSYMLWLVKASLVFIQLHALTNVHKYRRGASISFGKIIEMENQGLTNKKKEKTSETG